jgi:hypothetical protein
MQLALNQGANICGVSFQSVIETWDREVAQLFLEHGADPVTNAPFARAFKARVKAVLGIFLDCKRARPELAEALQRQADTALRSFQKANPRWNMNVVSFRLNDLAQNIAALSTSAAEANSSPGDSQVKLLEPGAEPRKVLRLHPKSGDQQTLSLAIKLAVNLKMGEVLDRKMKVPEMTMTMNVTVKSVTTAGDINYEIVMGDGTVAEDQEVMPQISEGLKAALANIKGLSGTGTMSSRGLNKALEVKAPENADPQTRQAVEQMKQALVTIYTPLPAEPVGIGGKWQAKMPIQSQGVKMDQTVTYELTSSDEESLTTKTTITQSAPKQKVQNPAIPALKFDLGKLEGQGTGETTLELSKLIPQAATANVQSDLMMEMNAEGQKQTVTMKIDENIQLSTK